MTLNMRSLNARWRLLDKPLNALIMGTVVTALGVGFVTLIAIYLIVRVSSYAYFKSRADVLRQDLLTLLHQAKKENRNG